SLHLRHQCVSRSLRALVRSLSPFSFFFLSPPATTVISTLSLHDALPISKCDSYLNQSLTNVPSILSHFSSSNASVFDRIVRKSGSAGMPRPSSYAVFCLKKKRKRC